MDDTIAISDDRLQAARERRVLVLRVDRLNKENAELKKKLKEMEKRD